MSFKSQTGHSHTLQARNEHDKRQWISCLQKAMVDIGNTSENTGSPVSTRSNKSSSSSLQSASSDDSSIPEEDSILRIPAPSSPNRSNETDV